jgi:hypothetical protein
MRTRDHAILVFFIKAECTNLGSSYGGNLWCLASGLLVGMQDDITETRPTLTDGSAPSGSMDELGQKFVYPRGEIVDSAGATRRPIWPWRMGTCDQESPHMCEGPWVLPCFQCHRAFCSFANNVDACARCGETVCNFYCADLHWSTCRGSRDFRKVPWSPRPSPSRLPQGSYFPPWLTKLRNGFSCKYCTCMRDIAAICCERCWTPQCLGDPCPSTVATCHGACGRDVCAPCRIRRQGLRGAFCLDCEEHGRRKRRRS